MKRIVAAVVLTGMAMLADGPVATASEAVPPRPTYTPATYTPDGRMVLPADYREWIFVSAGLDMSYRDAGSRPTSIFDNIFVDRLAYAAFKETGTWPDKTVLILELREARSEGSINKTGKFQTADLVAVEIHVKDEARFPGKWAFFVFDSPEPAAAVPRSEECYSCHEAHGAVDRTFVQFYPTLLPIAEKHGTLTKAYLDTARKEANFHAVR